MKIFTPSGFLAVTIIGTQMLGPADLWAAEQRGIRVEASRQIIVSALNGDQLTLQRVNGPSPLQFRDVVPEDARVTTGTGTTAELLLSNRAVLTLDAGTTVQVRMGSTDQTTIQVTTGAVRLSTAASALGSQGLVTVQTPTAQVQTRGGILQVAVDRPAGKAEHHPNGAQAFRASYTPELLMAAAPPSDLIQVEEGTAEIPGVGPTGGLLTVLAGQRVTIQAGRAGSPTEAGRVGAGTPGIPATTGHALTPKEGRDYLVALQVDQATKLGQALTGAAETGQKDSEKKSDIKNVINGATGGVTVQDALAKAFGAGPNAYSGTGGSAVNQSGTGAVDDSNDNPIRLLAGAVLPSFTTKGGSGLLLFTSQSPVKAIYDGPNDSKDNLDIFGFKDFTSLAQKQSKFGARQELLLVDGGNTADAPHGGQAPTSTLVARGVIGTNKVIPLQVADSFSAYRLDDPSSRIGTIAAHSSDSYKVNGLYINANNSAYLDNRGTDALSAMIGANAPVLLSKSSQDSRPVVLSKNLTFLEENGRTTVVFTNEACSSDRCYTSGPSVSERGSALSDFSSRPDGISSSVNSQDSFESFVDGSITARSPLSGDRFVTLAGGVVLDKGTTVSLGTTKATDDYFTKKSGLSTIDGNGKDTTFKGSLLAVMASQDGGFKPAFVKIQDRLLGVLDGSSITETGNNKTALLSVLDSRLIGPEASDQSTGANGRKPGEIAPLLEFDGAGQADRRATNATVTSAVVVRSTDVELDGALLTASSPLLAMMNATVIARGHFADLAGNNGRPALLASLVPGDALVRLNNATLTVAGNLLNLNNATAAISGYLFSLTNGSTLTLNGGSLFSLSDRSSLTLTGNAFGVFGNGTNTLKIDNNLCGAGAACGALVNSTGQAITLQDGTALKVAGVTGNVVLPNGFNVFAQAPNAGKVDVQIDANDALFQIDSKSTLTIKAK